MKVIICFLALLSINLNVFAQNQNCLSLEELRKTNFSFSESHLPQAIYSGSYLSWNIPDLKFNAVVLLKNLVL